MKKKVQKFEKTWLFKAKKNKHSGKNLSPKDFLTIVEVDTFFINVYDLLGLRILAPLKFIR